LHYRAPVTNPETVALVSGASKGIGAACALALSRRGIRVAIAARGREQLEQTGAEIEGDTGSEVLAVPADFTSEEQIGKAVDAVVARWGRLDYLVNNAGSSSFGPILDLTDQQWKDSFELKFFGYVRASRAVLPHMLSRRHGAIVNIAGNSAQLATPSNAPGGAANAALLHFTKSLALEVAKDGIRVNAVSPGAIATDRWAALVRSQYADHPPDRARELAGAQIPVGRPGEPGEIGNVVAFLLSDEAAFVTGANLLADGGMTRSV
jgi:NAD(P)-dependent dehydrogenase (short-subunit alcohol dehydrogenase family)